MLHEGSVLIRRQGTRDEGRSPGPASRLMERQTQLSTCQDCGQSPTADVIRTGQLEKKSEKAEQRGPVWRLVLDFFFSLFTAL